VRFLANENFPLPSIRLLSTAGHDVAAVALESPGVLDETVLDRAVQERRILCSPSTGITVVCSTSEAHKLLKASSTSALFHPHPRNRLSTFSHSLNDSPSLLGTLTVAERDRVRQRPLPGADRP
jgi:hypothetical protein